MDTIVLIVTAVLCVSCATAFVRIIRKGFHWKIILPILFSAILFIAGLSFNAEVKEFREEYPVSSKLILLLEDQEVLAGFSGLLTDQDDTLLLSQGDIDVINQQYLSKDYSGLRGDHYKIVYISLQGLSDVPGAVYFNGQIVEKNILLSIILADNAIEAYSNYIINLKIEEKQLDKKYGESAYEQLKVTIRQDIGDSAQLKGAVFSSMIAAGLEDQGQLFLFRGFRSKSITLYPEMQVFKLFTIIPDSLLRQVAG